MLETILLTLLFLVLCVTSYCDIKTREVPDWINYAALALALGLRLLYGIFVWNYSPILEGILGFLLFYIIGYAMFYTGQWGGGDSKLLMAIGAFLGLNFNLENNLVSFLVALILMGAVYGMLWSLGLAIKNKDKFLAEIKKMIFNKTYLLFHKICAIITILLFILVFVFKDQDSTFWPFFLLAPLPILFFYLFLFLKTVENCCMIKLVEPKELTEGDWIAKEIIISGKKICTPRDLGVTKTQIQKLIELRKAGKIKKVLLKTGIPFVPSFLLAFLFMLKFGNVLLKFI